MRFTKRLWSDEKGATAIEYGLLAALVAVAIILALQAVSTQLNSTFTNVSTELANAQPGAGGGGTPATP
jgi:pilus assembly protein Flp/PilA